MKYSYATIPSHGPYVVTRDGAVISPTFNEGLFEAIGWLHRHQGQSVDYAIRYGGEQPSANPLPFFRPRPDAEFDSYYCGCYGWD